MRSIIAALVFLAAVGAAEAQGLAKATFAGGCFWFMELAFDKLDGLCPAPPGAARLKRRGGDPSPGTAS